LNSLISLSLTFSTKKKDMNTNKLAINWQNFSLSLTLAQIFKNTIRSVTISLDSQNMSAKSDMLVSNKKHFRKWKLII